MPRYFEPICQFYALQADLEPWTNLERDFHAQPFLFQCLFVCLFVWLLHPMTLDWPAVNLEPRSQVLLAVSDITPRVDRREAFFSHQAASLVLRMLGLDAAWLPPSGRPINTLYTYRCLLLQQFLILFFSFYCVFSTLFVGEIPSIVQHSPQRFKQYRNYQRPLLGIGRKGKKNTGYLVLPGFCPFSVTSPRSILYARNVLNSAGNLTKNVNLFSTQIPLCTNRPN